MPVPKPLLDQLATKLAPAFEFLLPPATLVGLPAVPASDVDGLRTWFGSLDDTELRKVIARLPPGNELVAAVLQALAAPAVVAVPSNDPPHVVMEFVPVVDRHDVWNEILSLHTSVRRILVLKGEPRSGKSHLWQLVHEFCRRHAQICLYVDLDSMHTVDRVLALGLNTQLVGGIKVDSKLASDTADIAWARAAARAVFSRIGKEHPDQTVWLVFDHFDKMPLATEGEPGAFFNTLIDLVAKQSSTAAHAMRLVLIDTRDIPGEVHGRATIRRVERVSRDDIERFVRTCRPALTDARTITVRQQTCNGVTTTPKGRTRRTIPMTATLHQALKRMSTIREGFVVRNLDGSQKTDSEASCAIERICRKAGLPVQYWHRMRHSYGTHAALFGVNPWRLQGWMGHKRIEETMLYVHVADNHRREIPQSILAAGAGERDPDDRIVQMLGARGSHVAASARGVEETPVNLAG